MALFCTCQKTMATEGACTSVKIDSDNFISETKEYLKDYCCTEPPARRFCLDGEKWTIHIKPSTGKPNILSLLLCGSELQFYYQRALDQIEYNEYTVNGIGQYQFCTYPAIYFTAEIGTGEVKDHRISEYDGRCPQ